MQARPAQPMSTGSLSMPQRVASPQARSPQTPPGGIWSSSVEGRINNVLAWLDDTQEAESAELLDVKRQLAHPRPELSAIHRDDTLAAVKVLSTVLLEFASEIHHMQS